MTRPISQLRDDFTDATVAPTWAPVIAGSANYGESGGTANLNLPSSTAGNHSVQWRSTGTYDLTGDGFVWNINTMVATGVAANAFFQLLASDGAGGFQQLYWRQVSGTLTARTIVAGVETQLFTAAWNAVTYKYLRIREGSGNIIWESSTNGTSWTARAALTAPFAVTSLMVQFAASCGNVASPGSLKLDDVNLIALTTTWRWSQVERPSTDYVKTVTVSGTIGASASQGYIATSSDGVTWAYYTGPIGSASGGFDQLVLASSQSAAESMAVNIPLSGRWDLPTLVQCRFVRLYHRSMTAGNYRIDEFYPRRMVSSDDVEAESMKTVNFAAASVTADKIFVVNLAAINAFIGKLNIDLTGYLYQGTGSGDAPTTGLKIYNSGGIGKLSTYKATVEQISIDTDGALKAGAGAVVLDAGGIEITAPSTTATDVAAYKFVTSGGVVLGGMYAYDLSGAPNIGITVPAITGKDSTIFINAFSPTTKNAGILIRARDVTNQVVGIQINSSNAANGYYGKFLSSNPGSTQWSFQGGVNVGSTASGSDDGQITATGSAGFGVVAQSNIRVLARGLDTTSSNYCYFGQDSAGTTLFYVRNDGVGLLKAASWVYTSDKRLKENIIDLDIGLDTILLLNPQRFDYINGQKNQLGFIAQDIQKVLPDLVHVMDDGMLGVQTGNLIPVLVNAIKKLHARLNVLES